MHRILLFPALTIVKVLVLEASIEPSLQPAVAKQVPHSSSSTDATELKLTDFFSGKELKLMRREARRKRESSRNSIELSEIQRESGASSGASSATHIAASSPQSGAGSAYLY